MGDRRGLRARMEQMYRNSAGSESSEAPAPASTSAISNASLGLTPAPPGGVPVPGELLDLVTGAPVGPAPAPPVELPTRFSAGIFPGAPAGMTFVDADARRHELEEEEELGMYENQPVDLDQVIARTASRSKRGRSSVFTLVRDERGLSRRKRRRRVQRERPRSPAEAEAQMFTWGSASDAETASEENATSEIATTTGERSEGLSNAITEDSFFVADSSGAPSDEAYSESSSDADEDDDDEGDAGLGDALPEEARHPPTAAPQPSFHDSMPPSRRRASSQCSSDRGNGSETTLEEAGPALTSEAPADTDECFLCLFGNVQYDAVVSDKLRGLWNLFEENYFSMTDTEGLATSMYAYYLEEIYEPGIAEGQKLPRWSAQGVYYHITEHMGEPRIFVGESIKMLQKIRDAMKPYAIKRMGENEFKPDTRVVAEIRQLTKQIQDLYRSDPQEMFGFCEAFRADPQTMNRFVHMSRVVVEDRAAIEAAHGTFS